MGSHHAPTACRPASRQADPAITAERFGFMIKRRAFEIQLVALPALLASRAAWADAEHTLRFASISVAGSPTYARLLEPFAAAIERESGGRLAVALKPSGGYGKPTELISLVEKREIELAASVQGYNPGRFPRSSVLDLPLMFDTAAAGTRALNALFREGLVAEDYTGLKVLALYTVPPFALFTTGKKITSLQALRGLRVRVPSTTLGLGLARLGAIPLGVPVAGMGAAIAGGAVDAVLFSMDSTLGTKGAGDKYLSEQLSVVADLRIGAPAQIVVMNMAAWDELPPDQRAVIEKCSGDFVEDGLRYRDEAETAAAGKFRADPRYTFVPSSDELRDEMRRAMAPVFDDWKADMTRRGPDGERLLTRARELVKQFSVAAK
jgi:TRAP-type C4-dicarboxylate transport system substrate-binding protein